MLIITLLSPLLIFVWWGVTFTIINYVVQWAREKGITVELKQERARIIRYTELDHEDMPGLLSFYDEQTNILQIDRQEADRLPEQMRNRLEMTEEVFTKVANAGASIKFTPYFN